VLFSQRHYFLTLNRKKDKKMLYQTAEIVDGQVVITSTKVVDQSKLTSECFMIQINGLAACKNCEYLGKQDCGGKKTRKMLLA